MRYTTVVSSGHIIDMDRVYLSPPHMSGDERVLVQYAFDTNWIAPLGPHVDAFEREIAEATNVPHACALSSGTAALHLGLLMLGVGRDDDVLCPSLTFSATANAITYLGANPVFVDCDSSTWTVDANLVAEVLDDRACSNKLPRALVTVDLYGQCCDYDVLEAACVKHGVPILQDAAEALGATYKGKPAGGFGEMGVFSFNGNKIITCGGGGMLVSRNQAYTDRARFVATQARDAAPHYQHSEIGYNYRLSNVLAAIGRGQLRVLGDRVKARRANYDYYYRALGDLPGLDFMPEAPYGMSTRWLTCMTIDPEKFGASRDDISVALGKQNIEARPVWKPMHMQPVFEKCVAVGGEVSERLFRDGICLPSGSSMRAEDLERVSTIVRGVCRAA